MTISLVPRAIEQLLRLAESSTAVCDPRDHLASVLRAQPAVQLRRIFQELMDPWSSTFLPAVHVARFLDPRTVPDMLTPAIDDDDTDGNGRAGGDETVAPYTPSSVATIKRIHAMLMQQLPRTMPSTPLSCLSASAANSATEANVDVSAAKTLEQNIGTHLQRTIGIEDSAADCDPLAWWMEAAPDFPCLAEFARRYLAVPATTAESERLFSLSGAIVSPMRTRLSPEQVNQLVTTRPYYLKYDRAARNELEEQHAEVRGLGAAMIEDGDACVEDDGDLTLQSEHDEELDDGSPLA